MMMMRLNTVVPVLERRRRQLDDVIQASIRVVQRGHAARAGRRAGQPFRKALVHGRAVRNDGDQSTTFLEVVECLGDVLLSPARHH